MAVLRRWWVRRKSTHGLSSGVGMVGMVIAGTTVLTAGVSALQLMRAHTALTQAVQAAATSESQTGCWTAAATQAASASLTGAGVNPKTVRVTAGTAQSTRFGGMVTAGLATTVGVSVLGLARLHIPLAAAARAPSFYTPASSTGTNAACTTPTLCNQTPTPTVVRCAGPGLAVYTLTSCGQSGAFQWVAPAPSGQCP